MLWNLRFQCKCIINCMCSLNSHITLCSFFILVQLKDDQLAIEEYFTTQLFSHNTTVAQWWVKEEEGGTCRTLAPTLFLKPYDLGVGAKAVPCSAVVDGLEVSWHNVTHGQCGDDSVVCVDSLHSVATRCPRLQHGFLPGPGLRRQCSDGLMPLEFYKKMSFTF